MILKPAIPKVNPDQENFPNYLLVVTPKFHRHLPHSTGKIVRTPYISISVTFVDRIKQPEWVVAGSAALWGLFWVPLRAFESSGLDAAWTTISQFVAPLLVLAPFAFIRLLRGKPIGIRQFESGLLIGAAFALYCYSLLLTEVVRALILFYVMPSWGTLLECLFLGRRFTVWRALALIMGMGGLLTIVGIDHMDSLAFNLGDGLALLSGVVFAFGALKVRTASNVSVFEQLFAFFFFGAIVSLAMLLLPIDSAGGLPERAVVIELLPWIALMAVGFLIPVMGGIYWGSGLVDPGRLGILLQLEAVVGIGSAALFADEPFGIREALGAILVIGAGLVEVLGNREHNQPATPAARI